MMALVIVLVLATTAVGGEVRLSWEHPDPDSLDGFAIYYGTESRGYVYKDEVGVVFEHLVTSLHEGETYYFAAVAVSGDRESDYSNEVSYTVPDEPVRIPDPVPPFPPAPAPERTGGGCTTGAGADVALIILAIILITFLVGRR
jgi:hypothetical protein